MPKSLNEIQDYDELVDEVTRHLFDGLLTGGGKELRSRVWGLMHPLWRENLAKAKAAKRPRSLYTLETQRRSRRGEIDA